MKRIKIPVMYDLVSHIVQNQADLLDDMLDDDTLVEIFDDLNPYFSNVNFYGRSTMTSGYLLTNAIRQPEAIIYSPKYLGLLLELIRDNFPYSEAAKKEIDNVLDEIEKYMASDDYVHVPMREMFMPHKPPILTDTDEIIKEMKKFFTEKDKKVPVIIYDVVLERLMNVKLRLDLVGSDVVEVPMHVTDDRTSKTRTFLQLDENKKTKAVFLLCNNTARENKMRAQFLAHNIVHAGLIEKYNFLETMFHIYEIMTQNTQLAVVDSVQHVINMLEAFNIPEDFVSDVENQMEKEIKQVEKASAYYTNYIKRKLRDRLDRTRSQVENLHRQYVELLAEQQDNKRILNSFDKESIVEPAIELVKELYNMPSVFNFQNLSEDRIKYAVTFDTILNNYDPDEVAVSVLNRDMFEHAEDIFIEGKYVVCKQDIANFIADFMRKSKYYFRISQWVVFTIKEEELDVEFKDPSNYERIDKGERKLSIIQNPHLQYYNCQGTTRLHLTNAVSSRNYGAIPHILQNSIANLNLLDSVVVEKFARVSIDRIATVLQRGSEQDFLVDGNMVAIDLKQAFIDFLKETKYADKQEID